MYRLHQSTLAAGLRAVVALGLFLAGSGVLLSRAFAANELLERTGLPIARVLQGRTPLRLDAFPRHWGEREQGMVVGVVLGAVFVGVVLGSALGHQRLWRTALATLVVAYAMLGVPYAFLALEGLASTLAGKTAPIGALPVNESIGAMVCAPAVLVLAMLAAPLGWGLVRGVRTLRSRRWRRGLRVARGRRS